MASWYTIRAMGTKASDAAPVRRAAIAAESGVEPVTHVSSSSSTRSPSTSLLTLNASGSNDFCFYSPSTADESYEIAADSNPPRVGCAIAMRYSGVGMGSDRDGTTVTSVGGPPSTLARSTQCSFSHAHNTEARAGAYVFHCPLHLYWSIAVYQGPGETATVQGTIRSQAPANSACGVQSLPHL